jgi:hypothetical protein
MRVYCTLSVWGIGAESENLFLTSGHMHSY